jgi:hypothetical protein
VLFYWYNLKEQRFNMAITETDRLGLTQWSSGDDDFTREQMTTGNLKIADNAAIFIAGTSPTPPTADVTNTRAFYWDRTDGILYYRGDTLGVTTAAWIRIHPVDPNAHIHTNLQPIDPDLTALSALTGTGLVARTANDTYEPRSIVVSGSGISISNPAGIVGNPTISINSTSSADPLTIVLRDSAGQFQVGTPTLAAHPATKSYVDTADALKANSADVYTKDNIHEAKLYQYANESSGTGAALPSSGTRTTPRIYVQSTEPLLGGGAITGDIWFQI